MKRNNRAFTLIEIIVMVGILALLATLTINKMGDLLTGNQQAITKIFVNDTLKLALERYRIDVGSYPSTAEGLGALAVAPANASNTWRGPYADFSGGKVQPDPYGEPYQYRYPGTRNKTGYDLYSKGPDKAEGTEDDIGNW
jgi:general secretion pathway protein G